MTCPVCRGSKTIRLPYMRRLEVSFDEAPLEDLVASEPATKTYPCPECSASVPQDKVRTLELQQQVPGHVWEYAKDQDQIVNLAVVSMARGIADHLLQAGIIQHQVVKTPGEHDMNDRTIRVAVSVVDPHEARTISEHRRVNQERVAHVALNRVHDQVSVWGRDVGCRELTKEHIHRILDEVARGLQDVKLPDEELDV
jgi:hypothetical protein